MVRYSGEVDSLVRAVSEFVSAEILDSVQEDLGPLLDIDDVLLEELDEEFDLVETYEHHLPRELRLLFLDHVRALEHVLRMTIVIKLEQLAVVGVHELLVLTLLVRFNCEHVPVILIHPERPVLRRRRHFPLSESHDAVKDILGQL